MLVACRMSHVACLLNCKCVACCMLQVASCMFTLHDSVCMVHDAAYMLHAYQRIACCPASTLHAACCIALHVALSCRFCPVFPTPIHPRLESLQKTKILRSTFFFLGCVARKYARHTNTRNFFSFCNHRTPHPRRSEARRAEPRLVAAERAKRAKPQSAKQRLLPAPVHRALWTPALTLAPNA